MAGFVFRISEVFDLRARAGLLVVGTVVQGSARPGMTLRDLASGHCFPLMSIDLVCGRTPDGGGVALVVDRTQGACAQPGGVWVDHTPRP